MAPQQRRIMFVMRTTVYVRNFESTLRLLAERGHQVQVVADEHRLLDPTDLVGRLHDELPAITHLRPPERPVDGWTLLGDELRRAVDYFRYLGPEYRNAPKLRERAERNAPPFAVAAAVGNWSRLPGALRAAAATIRRADRALPIEPAVSEFVRRERPDLLIVTPLVEPGSPQTQYVRAASALGIRTALCVYSWDNLTNKGLIQDPLDLVTVWNEAMKQEAIDLHGVPPDKVVVTGAPGYDHWFTWQAREEREVFCRRVGLVPERPYLLYVCSSKFIAPQEVTYVREWIARIRHTSRPLADVGVLVRPHPQNTRLWLDADLGDLANVAIHPRGGGNPVDTDSRAEYFDSIFHSAGVVGVNTSALIESAIVGRGVYTLLAPDFKDTQEGTLHFQHLREAGGGVLHVAATLEDHCRQLGAAVEQGRGVQRPTRFVETFIRPFGIEHAAAPRLVEALERLASLPKPAPRRMPSYAGLVQRQCAARAQALAAGERRRQVHELARAQRRQEKTLRSVASASAKDARQTRRDERERQQQQSAADAQRFAARVLAVFAEVSARVETLKATAGVTSDLPAVQALKQSPAAVLPNLRRLSEHFGGARPADYVDTSDSLQKRFHFELRVLREQYGDELLVTEPAGLGQFGFARKGTVTTADTLRQFEIMVALHVAAVLPPCRRPQPRPIVWEVGGGWGGFAHAFKTLFPHVTYIISSHPDAFLVSATYLQVRFPSARVCFVGERDASTLLRKSEEVDFVFVPLQCPDALQGARVDLVLDMCALERMSAAAATAHVRIARAAGATYFYSPLASADASLNTARSALEQYYWLHQVPVHVARHRPALRPWPPPTGAEAAAVRAHVMGWARLTAA